MTKILSTPIFGRFVFKLVKTQASCALPGVLLKLCPLTIYLDANVLILTYYKVFMFVWADFLVDVNRLNRQIIFDNFSILLILIYNIFLFYI